MEEVRVAIVYQPRLYADLIARVLEEARSVTLVEPPFSGVDVVVFPLTEAGRPDVDALSRPIPQGTKLVAVSPGLDRGLVRLPGASRWEEVRPFGPRQLLGEVLAAGQRPVTVTHRIRPQARPARRAQERRPRQLARRGPLWAPAFAALVVVLSLSVSTLAVSAQSLPGEALYPVKRWSEGVQVALSPESLKPYVQLELAERRLQEIAALERKYVVMPPVVADIVADMVAATAAAQASAGQLPPDDQMAFFTQLSDLTQIQKTVLTEVMAQLAPDQPQAVRAGLEHALQVADDVRRSADEAVARGPVEPSTPSPTATQRTPPGQTHVPPAQTSIPPGQSRTSAPTESPVPTEASGQAGSAKPTKTPKATEVQQPTARLEQTAVPTPTDTEEPTRTPKPTKTEGPTDTPGPTETPEPTDTPEPTETPEPNEPPKPQA